VSRVIAAAVLVAGVLAEERGVVAGDRGVVAGECGVLEGCGP
jgi:hypothetical protein